MKVGILGTGMVGRTLATAVAAAGNDVTVGTREPAASLARTGEGEFGSWHADHAAIAVDTFAAAAESAELVFNATAGAASLRALEQAGPEGFAGKILVDVANPLDFSQGFPPSLTVANTDSLAEQIQRALPEARVVKTLNTVNAAVMVNPGAVGGGEHDLFICGDDEAARATVAGLLRGWFGWQSIIDLGDLSAARGMEAYLLLWVRMVGALGSRTFNIRAVGVREAGRGDDR